jgi:hypothetical protein
MHRCFSEELPLVKRRSNELALVVNLVVLLPVDCNWCRHQVRGDAEGVNDALTGRCQLSTESPAQPKIPL